MKVLLTTLNAKYIHLNLAIRLLYERNKMRGNLSWKEFTIKEKPDDIAIACSNYDVVAFSCYIWNITQTLATAKAIKKINPSVKILLGGPEVSYDYQEIISLPEIDYIIVGEGEIPFETFLANYPEVQQVPNLVQKINSKPQILHQQVTFNLQEYAGLNPYINDDTKELYNKVCYIETSRGCPYKCEFCLASLDNKVRYLPIADIKSNLLYLMEHGKTIKFLDRTFNVKKDFTIDIFKFILEHHKPGQIFQFEITADIVHPDIVAFIQEHVPKGLFRFEIGIQTVNQEANLQVSRKQNFDKTSAVIKQLDNKIDMHLDLIVGLPLDRWDDIKHSIEAVFNLYPQELQLGFLKFLKGTPVRTKHEQHGYVFDKSPPYQIIKSNYLSAQELEQITWLEEALEIYWNKKRAVHTLKYVAEKVGIFNFLLGLGSYFKQHKNFHNHTLYDVYDMLMEFCSTTYPNDNILPQLIAVDYYLHHKLKPKTLYLNEVERTEKAGFIERLSLNHHQYRFIILPLTFNINAFIHTGKIDLNNCVAIIQYDGRNKAQLLNLNTALITVYEQA